MTFPSKVSAWAQQAVNARAARTCIDACESAAIRVLPVKGIVSAVTLYDDPADRPLTDVDLRVVPSDVRRLEELCRARRWPIVQRMRSYANLVTIVDGVYVDVESHVGPPGMCNLQVSAMLDRAHDGLPDFTDHAVLLVVNAFKDKIVGAFEWAIRDLERIPTRDAFDLELFVHRLREARASTIGYVVARWLVEARRADDWRAIEEMLRPVARATYARAVRHVWARGADSLAARVLARASADSRVMRGRALALMVMWQAEVYWSKLGRAPYRRGHVDEEVRAAARE